MIIEGIITQHFRWRKCKDNLSTLTSTGGANRPGQAGTSGQLFFTKCGDPPQGCPCTYEPKTGESLASFDINNIKIPLHSLCGVVRQWPNLLRAARSSAPRIKICDEVINGAQCRA